MRRRSRRAEFLVTSLSDAFERLNDDIRCKPAISSTAGRALILPTGRARRPSAWKEVFSDAARIFQGAPKGLISLAGLKRANQLRRSRVQPGG